MAVTDRAAPYVNRLLDDSDLQRDLREGMQALRTSLNRADRKKRKPSKLLGDRKFKRSTERAALSLRDAGKRFRGEQPKSHRGRKLIVIMAVVGAGAFAAKRMLSEDDAGQVTPPAVA